MDYQQLIETMPRSTYDRLKQAVELGRWPDGSPVTAAQRADAMQAVIAWGERHLPQEERVGYIDKGRKQGGQCDELDESPLTWIDNNNE